MKALHKIFNFYTIFAMLAVIAGFGIRTALVKYESYLVEYEETQPFHLIDNIMDTYFSPPDYFIWAAEAPIENISEFEGLEHYQMLINTLLSDKTVHLRDESSNKTFTGDLKRYTVSAGNTPFAEFEVVKKPQPSSYGFDIWELSDLKAIAIPYAPQNSIMVSIIRGSTLYINEKPVGESYFVREYKTTDSVNHMPEGVTGIVYDLYKVNGLISEPDFYVTDKNGQIANLEYDKKTGVYTAEIKYDFLTDEIQALCTEALLEYCKYITNDGSINAVGRYFAKDTRLWRAISKSEVYWYTSHTGYDYKDTSVTEYYTYDDDTFSTRVKATQYIYRGSSRTDVFDIDFTFYFSRQENGSFMIYDMVSHV